MLLLCDIALCNEGVVTILTDPHNANRSFLVQAAETSSIQYCARICATLGYCTAFGLQVRARAAEGNTTRLLYAMNAMCKSQALY